MTLSTPLFLRDWMNDGLWKATHAGRTLLMTLSHCSSMSGPSLFEFDVSGHECQHDESDRIGNDRRRLASWRWSCPIVGHTISGWLVECAGIVEINHDVVVSC